MIFTTSVDIAEWSGAFGGAKMTTALLDRLKHHCHIIEAGNEAILALNLRRFSLISQG